MSSKPLVVRGVVVVVVVVAIISSDHFSQKTARSARNSCGGVVLFGSENTDTNCHFFYAQNFDRHKKRKDKKNNNTRKHKRQKRDKKETKTPL
jgi:hypothetical protein